MFCSHMYIIFQVLVGAIYDQENSTLYIDYLNHGDFSLSISSISGLLNVQFMILDVF